MGIQSQIVSLRAGQCMAELITGDGKVSYRIKNMEEALNPANINYTIETSYSFLQEVGKSLTW